jgi:nitrite reductase (NO-forming)
LGDANRLLKLSGSDTDISPIPFEEYRTVSILRLPAVLAISALSTIGYHAVEYPRPAAPAAADPADYQICSACHQANGEGIPKTFPPLAGSSIVNGPPGPHIAIVLKGLVGPITVKGQPYTGAMAPWESLTDAQIAGAVNYERTHWGNTGAQVTAADVASLRKRLAARTTPYTMADLKKVKF